MRSSKLIYVCLIVAALSAAGCIRESQPEHLRSGVSLFVRPTVRQDNGVSTKVADTSAGIQKDDLVDARDDLRENFFGSLDIFVKRQSDLATDAWFKEYHLNAGDEGVIVDPDKYDSESLLDKAKQALASNWAEQGYAPDVLYDIYVTANNPHTAAGAAPANLTDLQALTTGTPDIYRYYLGYSPGTDDPVYGSNWMNSTKKDFLMDGKIEGWKIDPSKAEQVFDVDLQRACAKVIVTVKFSDDKSLKMVKEPTPDNPNPEPEKDAYGRIVYGSIKEYMDYVGRTVGEPRWKPANFCLTGSDIAYAADPLPGSGTLETLSGNFTPFKEGTSTDNTENSFAFVTYTYPVDWSSDSQRIPYVLLSVFYTRNSDNDQLRSYYRIPVCDESSVTSLDRNHVYIVDVEIASLGASNESLEATDEQLRIEYHVIPWTETNMTQEATTVKISDTKYLTVIPTEYTLKGDGNESVDLQWYASVSTDDGRIVDINPSSLAVSYVNYLGNTTDIRGTVTKQIKTDAGTLVTATDANTDGKHDIVITSTAPTTATVANGEKLVITLSPNGMLKVESEALASRAVKDITFTVYLKNASGVDAVPIHIRHFPLDNIQSFTGSWSSRWDGTTTTGTLRQYSFNPEKDGWGSPSLYNYEENVECSLKEYNIAYTGKSIVEGNYGTPSDHDATDYRVNYTSGGNESNVQTQYRNNVSQDERSANEGESNAILGSDGFWYWGSTRTNGSRTNYDWYQGGMFSRTYYRWTTYYRSQYKKTHYRARRYYREVTADIPSTGNWVDWENKTGTIVSEGIYDAKIYSGGYCREINYNNGNYSIGDIVGSTLTNNHMYVLQVTSTSDKYVLGRPVLDGNYQSQDKVVSPAFMIASQLGAVTPTNSGTTAATHCGTYMEVGTDGTRYVGWRLPTKQEIEVIIDYQNGDYTSGVTMVEVLGGQYYWSLDGTSAYVSTGSQGSATNAYVRCVRDLTLAEVNSLNQTGN